MAYNASRNRLVLFGGAASGSAVGDTWEWDGNNWTQRQDTRPAARLAHAMAYDDQRGRVVLFGGVRSEPPGDDQLLGDTWEHKCRAHVGPIWAFLPWRGPRFPGHCGGSDQSPGRTGRRYHRH